VSHVNPNIKNFLEGEKNKGKKKPTINKHNESPSGDRFVAPGDVVIKVATVGRCL
jgi:hypothetical protein